MYSRNKLLNNIYEAIQKGLTDAINFSFDDDDTILQPLKKTNASKNSVAINMSNIINSYSSELFRKDSYYDISANALSNGSIELFYMSKSTNENQKCATIEFINDNTINVSYNWGYIFAHEVTKCAVIPVMDFLIDLEKICNRTTNISINTLTIQYNRNIYSSETVTIFERMFTDPKYIKYHPKKIVITDTNGNVISPKDILVGIFSDYTKQYTHPAIDQLINYLGNMDYNNILLDPLIIDTQTMKSLYSLDIQPNKYIEENGLNAYFNDANYEDAILKTKLLMANSNNHKSLYDQDRKISELTNGGNNAVRRQTIDKKLKITQKDLYKFLSNTFAKYAILSVECKLPCLVDVARGYIQNGKTVFHVSTMHDLNSIQPMQYLDGAYDAIKAQQIEAKYIYPMPDGSIKPICQLTQFDYVTIGSYFYQYYLDNKK